MPLRYAAFPCLMGLAAGAACAPAWASDHYVIGVEGFRDHYQEPGPDLQVDSHADYGSLTGSYIHGDAGWFGAADGRVSYGENDYKSISGTVDNVPQWEGEARLRGGLNTAVGATGNLKTYIGLGLRYFYDEGDGTVTNLSKFGYDRKITQLYLPVGATYKFTWGSWTFSPTAEVDPLLWGRVESDLTSLGGPDLVNTQHSGYGLRAEFMVGQQLNGYGWQVGPFIRYWNIHKSDITYDLPTGIGGYEPQNERLQAGGALRLIF